MAGPLLETKLHVPRWRRGLVARPRLSERLSRGAESALTLVSAPAGFGKTTLLAEWLAVAAAGGRSVAWLSLDQRDNDPALFWAYVVAALNTGSSAGDPAKPTTMTEAGTGSLIPRAARNAVTGSGTVSSSHSCASSRRAARFAKRK